MTKNELSSWEIFLIIDNPMSKELASNVYSNFLKAIVNTKESKMDTQLNRRIIRNATWAFTFTCILCSFFLSVYLFISKYILRLLNFNVNKLSSDIFFDIYLHRIKNYIFVRKVS